MSKYVIVWNSGKTEGVILRDDQPQDDGHCDARHAANLTRENPVSSLADAFLDIYGMEDDCHLQTVNINEAKAVPVSEVKL